MTQQTRLILFAIQDKVHVDRDKLFQLINGDATEDTPTKITSTEIREFQDELEKVMPPLQAQEIANIFTRMYGVTRKTLPDFLVSDKHY